MKQIDIKEFDELLKGDKPVVCDFFATWCGPCKMLAPVLEKLSAEYEGKAEFVKVDIDQNPELSVRYGIMSIPYVAVFRGGEMADNSIGFMPADEAKEFLDKNIG
ncbi:MAG: thioredoxin [Clostridia bacterium]|nr:thioredoxin [Clostridia bacterium]